MSNVQIPNLSVAIALSGAEELEIVQEGVSARTTTRNVANLFATASAPSSASANGTAGQIAWDSSYIYVCTATNTWKRSALSSW